MIAFSKYLTPPCINFVERDDVPDAKSLHSTKPTFKPRVIPSNAIPAPVAPPPIINIS